MLREKGLRNEAHSSAFRRFGFSWPDGGCISNTYTSPGLPRLVHCERERERESQGAQVNPLNPRLSLPLPRCLIWWGSATETAWHSRPPPSIGLNRRRRVPKRNERNLPGTGGEEDECSDDWRLEIRLAKTVSLIAVIPGPPGPGPGTPSPRVGQG